MERRDIKFNWLLGIATATLLLQCSHPVLALNDEALLEQAVVEDRQEHYPEAIRLLSHYLKVYPKNARALKIRADAQLNSGNYLGAVADFTAAIKLDPSDCLLYSLRGQAYHNLRKLPESIRDHTRDIKCSSKKALPYLNRAIVEIEAGRYRAAIRDCTESIRIKPSYSAYYHRGDAYKGLSMEKEAERDYNKARQQPGNGPPEE